MNDELKMSESDRQRMAAIAGGPDKITPRHLELYAYFRGLQHRVVPGNLELPLLLIVHQQATEGGIEMGRYAPGPESAGMIVDTDSYQELPQNEPGIDWKQVAKGSPIHVATDSGEQPAVYRGRQGKTRLVVEIQGTRVYVPADACRLAS